MVEVGTTVHETQARLLDAAEELFARKGFEAVSLREITAAAEANLAAVNYHFGSKEKLIGAVMSRCAMPVNQQRIDQLNVLLAKPQPPSVREVVEAFLRPLVRLIQERETNQRLFARFMGRMMGEAGKSLPPEAVPSFQLMAEKVILGFRAAVPELTEEQAYLRLKFCFAVMANSMMKDEVFEQISQGRLSDWQLEQVFEEVLDFCEGGLKR